MVNDDEQSGMALIVTRDPAVRDRCAGMLQAAGLGTCTAGDRDAALAVFARGGIDVVVASDVEGAALLQAIRRHDEHLPVIFVTEWPDFSRARPFAIGSHQTPRSPAESLRSAVIAAAITYHGMKRR